MVKFVLYLFGSIGMLLIFLCSVDLYDFYGCGLMMRESSGTRASRYLRRTVFTSSSLKFK